MNSLSLLRPRGLKVIEPEDFFTKESYKVKTYKIDTPSNYFKLLNVVHVAVNILIYCTRVRVHQQNQGVGIFIYTCILKAHLMKFDQFIKKKKKRLRKNFRCLSMYGH